MYSPFCIVLLYASFFPWQYIHVLVCPRREVKRFADLSSDEISDLWVTTKEVGARLEQYHKASSLTFAIQVWSALQFYCCSVLILSVLITQICYGLLSCYILCWHTWNCLLTSDITYQDGPEAGQTVPHVHIHVIPRKKGDFEKNDEIYDAVHDIVFYQSCYFIMMSDQIKLALFLGIIDWCERERIEGEAWPGHWEER